MQELTTFNFNDHDIKVLIIDGEPWFLAKGVCDVLEIANNRDALSRLKEYEKGVATTDTLGGSQEVNIISESGLYRLVLTSRKPQAEPFQDWVVQKVLPSIRKTGLYNSLPFKLEEGSKLVSFEGDDYWVVSTSIADIFEKRHDNVLRDLETAMTELNNLLTTEEVKRFRLVDCPYVDQRQRTYSAKKVNRALFNYVVLSYKGEVAKVYRSKFILAFEELERKVKVYLAQQMVYDNPKRQQVYVLRNTVSGMVKVGITNNIDRRVAELQNASGCEISVEYLAPKSDNAKDVEQTMHQLLAEHRGLGEWFAINPKEVIDLLLEQDLIIQPQRLLSGALP